MTEENDRVEEAEQIVGPHAPGRPRLPTAARAGDSGEDDEDAAADERTKPFPYAEKFDEWIADETGAGADGRQRP